MENMSASQKDCENNTESKCENNANSCLDSCGKKSKPCSCGRSPTRRCNGWHKLSQEDFEHMEELYKTGQIDSNGKDI